MPQGLHGGIFCRRVLREVRSTPSAWGEAFAKVNHFIVPTIWDTVFTRGPFLPAVGWDSARDTG
jgi:hypothetical protein